MDLGLDGKVALVTGSYRGTGAGIARMLAAEGATVLVHGFEPGQQRNATVISPGGSVAIPGRPMVATKAKARVTPPN